MRLRTTLGTASGIGAMASKQTAAIVLTIAIVLLVGMLLFALLFVFAMITGQRKHALAVLDRFVDCISVLRTGKPRPSRTSSP